jgi:hypothetical protein
LMEDNFFGSSVLLHHDGITGTHFDNVGTGYV